jgi:DHA1 family bicyclomycin/chloramphenicol resistance-like MFS transporter
MSETKRLARAPLSMLVTLVMVCAVAPASTNIVMPALPAIQAEFGVATSTAQFIVSLSILCVALSTLVYGPLSDRHGRRPVLLAGLALFVFGSVVCVFAQSIGLLIAARVVQAVGGAAGLVLTRAIVRDMFDREATARVLAYLMMAMVVAPMLSPLIGGFLTDTVSWRAIFVFTAAAGAVVLLAVVLRLPETRATAAAGASLAAMLRGFAALLRSPVFCAYAAQSAVLMSMFYVFTATTPYLMVFVFKRPATEYGLYFMLLSVGYIIGSFVSTRLTPRIGIDRTILLGSAFCVAGGTGVFALAVAGIWGPLALFLPLALSTMANGLAQPNLQAVAVSINPALAGSASGLLTFAQMGLAAASTQFVGTLDHDSPVPLGATLIVMSTIGLVAFGGTLRFRQLRRAAPTA